MEPVEERCIIRMLGSKLEAAIAMLDDDVFDNRRRLGKL
jgi:hypothetical protein